MSFVFPNIDINATCLEVLLTKIFFIDVSGQLASYLMPPHYTKFL